jgi:hypothetical protein
MKCPESDSDNRPDSKSCRECATSLSGDEQAESSFSKIISTPFHTVARGTVFARLCEILEKSGEGGRGEVYGAVTGASTLFKGDC